MNIHVTLQVRRGAEASQKPCPGEPRSAAPGALQVQPHSAGSSLDQSRKVSLSASCLPEVLAKIDKTSAWIVLLQGLRLMLVIVILKTSFPTFS